jgi:hypothetical protein
VGFPNCYVSPIGTFYGGNMAALFLNVYNIINTAVSEGIEGGIQRAHKYTDTPSKAELHKEIENAVMLSLADFIDFDRYKINPLEEKGGSKD